MNEGVREPAMSLVGSYSPVAIYYEEADLVEYVRKDVPVIHSRVDDFLTLVLDLENREPIGFTLKGFKNYYVRHFKAKQELLDLEFVRLTSVLEDAVNVIGNSVFDDRARQAYRTAHEIAEHDNVELRELPEAA